MIAIAAIDVNGMMMPETPQTLTFGSYFDGVNFNYFESQQEADEYAASVVVPLDDPRKQPDYYLVRELAGKALVNEVATELLLKYKSGELTIVQVMEIEQILDNTMSSLGRGQIISALFHIGNVTGIDSTFKASIASRIQALKLVHYA